MVASNTVSEEKSAKIVSENALNALNSTENVFVSKKLVDQVVGQERAVEIVRKAAAQKRNVLLIGLPGTGKSMIAQAMSEILPVSTLKDVLIYPNEEDSNNPKVRLVPAGEGKKILEKSRLEAKSQEDNLRLISLIFPLGWLLLGFVVWRLGWVSDVIYAATLIVGVILFLGFALGSQIRSKGGVIVPKLLINNYGKKIAPFAEATGARAGALLGDVRHDPLQCHYGFNELYLQKEGKNEPEMVKKTFIELWEELYPKYKERKEITSTEDGQEAFHLSGEDKIFTLGYKDGKIVFSRILSMNRQPFEGEMIDINAEGKTVRLTPEHKVFTSNGSVTAGKISKTNQIIKILNTELVKIFARNQ